ncbi:hypothetical protein ABIE67_001675 [Streptomyces sp. V4I8]|uniref:hypothetical protein n=1 Tax=Streptomyces sp. V4I8 TaxID=3156469 RepID=UPI003518605D
MTNTETAEHRPDGEAPLTPAPTTPAEWDELIDDWDEIRQGYHLGDARRAVLDCARHLEASVTADGPGTALWTLGLVLTGPYVIYAHPDGPAEARVLKAMSTVEQAFGQMSCAHDEHPGDDMPLDDELDNLRYVLEMLAHPERDTGEGALTEDERRPDDDSDTWFERRMTRDVWACPQNLAGFARAFADS